MTIRDGLEHIAAVIILISASDLYSLVPNGRLQAQFGTPVEFDEYCLTASLISRKLCTPKRSMNLMDTKRMSPEQQVAAWPKLWLHSDRHGRHNWLSDAEINQYQQSQFSAVVCRVTNCACEW
jgi:hypothetical protein